MVRDEESDTYKLIITVEEIEGECPVYGEGDEMVIDDFYVVTGESKNVCIHALSAMTSFLPAFLNGISAQKLGLSKEENVAYVQCPDPGPPCTEGGTVLFKLERR